MAVHIELATGSEREERTRARLVMLFHRYDLTPWTFTEEVVIDEGARIPHSHPVLTLTTRDLDDDMLLLANYLHEQLHWFTLAPSVREHAWAAMEVFDTLYPDMPIDPPQGSGSRMGNRAHLIICPLEIASLRILAGEEVARRVLGLWCDHHYTALYALVRDEEARLNAVLATHPLLLADVIG